MSEANSKRQKKRLAQRLKDIQATQRATARVLGVGTMTVNRDLGTNVSNVPNRPRKPRESADFVGDVVPNGTTHSEIPRKTAALDSGFDPNRPNVPTALETLRHAWGKASAEERAIFRAEILAESPSAIV